MSDLRFHHKQVLQIALSSYPPDYKPTRFHKFKAWFWNLILPPHIQFKFYDDPPNPTQDKSQVEIIQHKKKELQ